MSLVMFTGFDYSSNPVPPFSSVDGPTTSTSAVRTGVNGVQGGGNGNLNYSIPAIPMSGLSNTYYIGIAIKNPDSNTKIVFMNNAFAVTQHNIRFNTTTRGIEQFNGTAGAVSAGPPNAYDPTVWNYFEFKIVAGTGTNGSIEVRINGIVYNTWTGITTINNATYTQFDGIRITIPSTNNKIDDFYLLNASGTINNNFLGDSRVDVLVPTGSGTYTQLTTFGSSQNWQNVDEVPANTSDYNYSDVVGTQDTYTFADLPASTLSIAAVQSQIYAAKTATGPRNVDPLILSNGILVVGSDFALSQSFTYTTQVYERDPGTGAAWTLSGFNAAEFGVRVN